MRHRSQDARWRALTEPAKDLILKLLQPDPKNRFTAKQALNHRWIKGAREDSILDGSVMEGWADHLQMLHPGYMGSPSPCAPPPLMLAASEPRCCSQLAV